MPRDLESYRDGIDVGREQMQTEVERLTADRDWYKEQYTLIYQTCAHRGAENARLRDLLKGVVREADRETNAFIAARAELGE